MSGNQKFIKLQVDQIYMFWSILKHAIIQTHKIPTEHQPAYSVKVLERLLTGMSQAWIGFELTEENEKKINFILITKIIDEKFYGIRTLLFESLYGLRLMTEELVLEAYKHLEKYAKENKCDVIVAEYSNRRVQGIMDTLGFEDHKTISRKFII